MYCFGDQYVTLLTWRWSGLLYEKGITEAFDGAEAWIIILNRVGRNIHI